MWVWAENKKTNKKTVKSRYIFAKNSIIDI